MTLLSLGSIFSPCTTPRRGRLQTSAGGLTFFCKRTDIEKKHQRPNRAIWNSMYQPSRLVVAVVKECAELSFLGKSPDPSDERQQNPFPVERDEEV